jgi:hypothetical protein
MRCESEKEFWKSSLTLPHAKDVAYPYARRFNTLYHNGRKMIREKKPNQIPKVHLSPSI